MGVVGNICKMYSSKECFDSQGYFSLFNAFIIFRMIDD